jgi:hypothetical protein
MQPSNADMSSTDRKHRSCWENFWCGGYRQAVSDIHNRWRCAGLKFLAFLWLSGLCLSLTILSQLSTTTDALALTSDRLVACQPNGVFDLYPEKYRYWSGAGFFQITLGHGKLSFTQAKVIDVVWDIVSEQIPRRQRGTYAISCALTCDSGRFVLEVVKPLSLLFHGVSSPITSPRQWRPRL